MLYLFKNPKFKAYGRIQGSLVSYKTCSIFYTTFYIKFLAIAKIDKRTSKKGLLHSFNFAIVVDGDSWKMLSFSISQNIGVKWQDIWWMRRVWKFCFWEIQRLPKVSRNKGRVFIAGHHSGTTENQSLFWLAQQKLLRSLKNGW